MPKLRVLMIEDSVLAREVQVMMFERRGYQVRACGDLDEMRAAAKDFDPEVIVTDVELADATVEEACAALRETFGDDKPLLLFSGREDHELKALAQKLGADGFINKGDKRQTVYEKVEAAVQISSKVAPSAAPPPKKQPQPVAFDTAAPKDVHVLLLEDDSVDAEAVRRAFRKARIANRLTVARDGVEGLAMLRGEDGHEAVSKPYIIILDLNMPRMDGIEFLGELRKDPVHHDAVVFVLTTSQADEDRAASYDKHVAGYIVKSEVGVGFLKVTELLGSYWRVVMLPG